MEMERIEFSDSELKGFQAFFPSSPGAFFLNRMMVRNAEEYEQALHDPASSLEQLRFAQGALDAQGKLVGLIKRFMDYVPPTGGEDTEGSEDGEEAVPDLNF